MRPFPHSGSKSFPASCLGVCALLMGAVVCESGCAVVGSKASQNPPPAQNIGVTVTASSESALLGNQLTFSATLTNTSDSTVSWSVGGVAGGTATAGTITSAGVYTAPARLPVPASVQITATSHADAARSASVTITVLSDVSVTIAPGAAAVELGATRPFVASVSSAGHPDKTVLWSVSGVACPLACGSVDAGGNYTAPQILPAPANVTLTARSVADGAKQASVTVNVTSNFALQLSVPATVAPGAVATFTATLTPAAGSNPSAALVWALAGAGCNGAACGTLTVVTIRGAGGSATAVTASYTAPLTSPNPDSIVVTVTPQADPGKAAQQSFAIQGGAGGGGVTLTVSPGTATRAINHRITLTAQVSGTANTGVNWNVNGFAVGNTGVGQVCVVGSNPCQAVSGGNVLQVDYVAPGAPPAMNPVAVQAVSAADGTKSASAQITIINHVQVSVLPGSVSLAPLGVQLFAATVLGTDNQNVVWQIQGATCAAGSCGSITNSGVYTAPGTAPAPDALQVVALSSEDSSQMGIANVAISTGLNIATLHPASVYAGAANGFTLRVNGSGFAPSGSAAGGSILLIAGTARTTTCTATDVCVAPVTAADVALAGSVSVQLQNPDNSRSNAVALVVAPPNVADEVIALRAGAPEVAGKDIVVVEPTTAGVSVPGADVDLNVAALGVFSAANNACTLGGNPVALTRPATGVAAADICLFSQSGLDASMTFTVSGPGDLAVIGKQPLGLGIIRLTLQVPATAAPSARTLFIQNTNLDKTAASGTLWVN